MAQPFKSEANHLQTSLDRTPKSLEEPAPFSDISRSGVRRASRQKDPRFYPVSLKMRQRES